MQYCGIIVLWRTCSHCTDSDLDPYSKPDGYIGLHRKYPHCTDLISVLPISAQEMSPSPYSSPVSDNVFKPLKHINFRYDAAVEKYRDLLSILREEVTTQVHLIRIHSLCLL